MYVRLISPTQIQQVPQTWSWPDGRTTSNFHLSAADVLARAGFLPLVDGERPTPGPTENIGPPTYTSDGQTITATYPLVPKPAEQQNSESITSKVQAAIDANVTWLGGHTTRQATIDQMKTDATNGKTATVTTVAQAQAAIRQTADLCLRLAQAVDGAEARLLALTRQVTAIERQIAGRLEATDGT